MDFKPTEEQEAICLAATGTQKNLFIVADAGCAKTSTLQLLSSRLRPQPALALAFNKKIAQELEKALPQWFTVKTLNGLGHGALARAPYLQGRRLNLVDRKIGKLVTEVLKEASYEATEEDWSKVRDLAEAARKAGIVHKEFEGRFPGLKPDLPEEWLALSDEAEPDGNLLDFAREVLRRSIAEVLKGNIDFDDQIYGSCLLGGIYPQFPLLLGDETQDFSPMNHLQVQKLGKQTRLIIAGDPKQSLYFFRGADSRSMEKLKLMRPADSWLTLPLHTTFRCPKVVVARQQAHAPGYRAAEGNSEGEYHDWRPKEKGILHGGHVHEGWSFAWLKELKQSPSDRIFILCRNNAPLLGLAFKLIRQGIGPEMLGRDIGQMLVRLGKSIFKGKKELDRKAMLETIERWERNEVAKAELMHREHLVNGIEDKAECLKTVLENEGIAKPEDLIRGLENLFSREHGEVDLATGHRAKGLEREIVVILDSWRLVTKRDLANPIELEQAKNNRYVQETRTRRVLVEANLEDFI